MTGHESVIVLIAVLVAAGALYACHLYIDEAIDRARAQRAAIEWSRLQRFFRQAERDFHGSAR